jgi:orotate phosphoribosyltransferase
LGNKKTSAFIPKKIAGAPDLRGGNSYFYTMEILNPTVAAQVARHLLEIQAIRLQPEKPFTWASGWKSPIYCDNRLSLS